MLKLTRRRRHTRSNKYQVTSVGFDITQQQRFTRLYQRYGKLAATKILAATERDGRRLSAALLQRLFCLKEAMIKALGGGVSMRDIKFSAASIELRRRAQRRAEALGVRHVDWQCNKQSQYLHAEIWLIAKKNSAVDRDPRLSLRNSRSQ